MTHRYASLLSSSSTTRNAHMAASAIGMKVPSKVHQETGGQILLWKRKEKRPPELSSSESEASPTSVSHINKMRTM